MSTINFTSALARQRQKVTLVRMEDRDSFKKAAQLGKYGIEVALIKVILADTF